MLYNNYSSFLRRGVHNYPLMLNYLMQFESFCTVRDKNATNKVFKLKRKIFWHNVLTFSYSTFRLTLPIIFVGLKRWFATAEFVGENAQAPDVN